MVSFVGLIDRVLATKWRKPLNMNNIVFVFLLHLLSIIYIDFRVSISCFIIHQTSSHVKLAKVMLIKLKIQQKIVRTMKVHNFLLYLMT